jgi:hypothetical protein
MAAAENSALALEDRSAPGDRYSVQVRYAGESDWADSTVHVELLPAEWASRLVRELNEVATGVVYRCVLVEVAHG